MDTLTQITLGAAVGELTLGRRVGNKALLWGGVAGLVPDLDMLASPFLDPVSRMAFHRGFTHSILFALLFAPVLGYLIYRVYGRRQASATAWMNLVFWATVTHPLLDCFTAYGTRLFWPFSDYRVTWNSIFVIDPLYSLPFAASVLALLFFRRTDQRRRWINLFGLGFSSLYLMFTVVNKQYVTHQFKAQLNRQHIPFREIRTGPTPFNNLLWRGVAQTADGFYEGFYSLLDGNRPVVFTFTPQNRELLAPYRNSPKIKTLLWITGGFYAIEENNGHLYFNDMRYGRMNGWAQLDGPFIFSFQITPPVEDPSAAPRIQRIRPKLPLNREAFQRLWRRMLGAADFHTG